MASRFLRSGALALLALGLVALIPGCGDEEVPAPTTPAPAPPTPTPTPTPEPDPPATPEGLRISDRGADFIEWSWTPVPDVSGYDAQYSTNEAFTGEDEIIVRTAEQFSYRKTGLAAETSGYLRVRSATGTGDDRLTSDWSAHLMGMTTAAAPMVPGTPMNLRTTGQTDTTITWSWNEVPDAVGYEVQDSGSATIPDDARRGFTSRTTHTVTGLPSRSDRYLRVRAYFGTISEPVFGAWSETVKGASERPPAPTVRELSAPTNVRAGTPTNATIRLTWSTDEDEVDEVARYEVQQRVGTGTWGGATCGPGDDEFVTDEECVASRLEQGTAYQFQVRAHPEEDDDTRQVSDWSSPSASEQTTGTAKEEEVTGGDDPLGITWTSEMSTEAPPQGTITWSWTPASDARIQYQVAVLRSGSCPSLGTEADAPTTFVDAASDAANSGWFAAESEFAKTLAVNGDTGGGGDRGQKRGLCVVGTWEDGDGNTQYGDVSLVWATTPPAEPDAAPTGGVADGQKPEPSTSAGTKTNAIDWYVTLESGFDYNVQIVSQTYENAGTILDCADASGTITKLTGTRYRLPNPLTYRTYAPCVTARNERGSSSPARLTRYHTPPEAPTFGTITPPTYTRGNSGATPSVTAEWSGNMVWHFGGEPDSAMRYEIVVETASSATDSRNVNMCGTGTNLVTTATDSVATGNTGTGAFRVEIPATGTGSLGLVRATTTTEDVDNHIRSCVRARLGGSGTVVGPWKVDGRNLVAMKHIS